MPRAIVNNIEIEYETFGDSTSNPLLLISALGTQMIGWSVEFCELLAKRGFFVIRFDNRDVGLSTKFDEQGVSNVIEIITKLNKGEDIEIPYHLEDMADDAIGLLDALNINKAHICGASMGAAITQIIALRHPSRVFTITSIMGSTGNLNLPLATSEATEALNEPPPTDRQSYIRYSVKRRRVFHGNNIQYNEKNAEIYAATSYDRCFHPQGTARQFIALSASGNRKPALSSVNVPTLVIHGSEDPLIPVDAGKDTAEAIPGAELLIINGMGHTMLCPETWDQIVDAITINASKVNK